MVLTNKRQFTDKSEKELHKKMYREYIELMTAVLNIYEGTSTKAIPFTIQIDILSSLFEANDNSEEGEGGNHGFGEKC